MHILTLNTKNAKKKKKIGARGDIFAYHALGTVPILTKSVKNGQNINYL